MDHDEEDERKKNWAPLSPENYQRLKRLYYDEKNIFGRDKLWSVFKSRYPDENVSQRSIMEEFLKKQELHQRITRNQAKGSIKPILVRESGHFQLDCGNLQSIRRNNFAYFVCMVDILTKRVFGKPLRSQDQVSVRNFLNELLEDGVEMKSITSDNGQENLGLVQEWARENGVDWRLTKSHTPQSNGAAERTVQTIKKMIYAAVRAGDRNWVAFFPRIIENINNSPSFGAGLKTPAEIEADLEGAYEKMRAKKMKGRGFRFKPKFKVGDRVRRLLPQIGTNIRRRAKQGYFGDDIYTIVGSVKSRHPNFQDSYKLADEDGNVLKGLHAAYSLRLVPEGTEQLERVHNLPPDEEGRYEIDSIVAKRTRRTRNGNVVEYKVKWVGYPGQDSWESREQLLEDAPDAVYEFENTH